MSESGAPGGVEAADTGGPRLLIAMALASGITSVPNAAIVLALPVIHRQFDATLTVLEWTVTGYLLGYSALMIAAGRLADVFGRMRLLRWGTLLFAGASIPAAVSGSSTVLILGLIVVGIGGAVLTPASLAVVTNSFRGPRRGMAVGVWGGATALASGIAPAIGGVFTQEASWRWILWLNVIVGVLILLGSWGAEESFDEDAGRHIDVTGALLSVAGLGALVVAFNEAPDTWAFGSAQFILVAAAGVLLLAGFVVLERRLREPLIDMGIFLRRNVSGSAIVLLVLNFAFGAVLFFLALFLEEQLGFGALKTGLLMLPLSVVMMVAMPFGGRAFERLGPIPPIAAGMVISGVAMLLFGTVSTSTRYGGLWLPLVLLGLGMGIALTPINLAALNATSLRSHGTMGALLSMVAGIGGMFGVAITGAVFEQLQSRDIVNAAAARGTQLSHAAAGNLSGLMSGTPTANHALANYPAAQQPGIKAAVHEGFVSAFGGSMLLSFGLVVLGLVIALWLIRRQPEAEPLARPNMTDPFSGLAPRP
jgi:EmrB/QacA subfamily drug resistance transporter